MLLIQAFLKSTLQLLVTILMDELRITSEAERSISCFLHIKQTTQQLLNANAFLAETKPHAT